MAKLDDAIAKARAIAKEEHTHQALCLAKTWKTQLVQFNKVIEQQGGKWCVLSEDRSKSLGCYDTKKEAKERLQQVEHFKKAAKAFLVQSQGEDVEVFSGLDAPSSAIPLVKALQKLEGEAASKLLGEVTEFISIFKVNILSSDTAPTERSNAKKGLPDWNLEGGIHLHRLTRENAYTKLDGMHTHVFLVRSIIEEIIDGISKPAYENEVLLVSDEDGAHYHSFSESSANTTGMDGEHFHKIVYWEDVRDANGDLDYREVELDTTENGAHSHQLQVSTTAFDGLHTHTLELPDGKSVTSLSPGQVWQELYDEEPQSGLPPLPPSSLFARLSDEQRGALAAMESMAKTAGNPSKTETKEEIDYTKEKLPALKLPDPNFIIKRLTYQMTAGLLSTQNREKRIGKSQVLVNELTPLEFDASFAWGIVQQEAPQKFETFDTIPSELLEGLDPYTRKEFGKLDSAIYYLPITLIKSFSPPLKLQKPPSGRRLAGKVDLAKDTVQVYKCKECESPFESLDGTQGFCANCGKNGSKIAKALSRGFSVKVVKTEETAEERIIFGAVLVPDIADAQGDIYSAEEVKKACYSYMEIYGAQHKIMHKGELLEDKVALLENYLSKFEENWSDKGDEDMYPAGTWFQAIRANDDGIWKDAKGGIFTGFSIGGSAVSESLA